MEYKIYRTFARDEAYLKIRDWIIQGRFQPGMKLRDKELAEKMGISRTPIREALLKLENEGLVITKPNSSTIVSPIDFEGAEHLYSIVWTLEVLALRQSFEKIDETLIKSMIEINERFLEKMNAKNCVAAINADCDFHAVYIEASQNKELIRILSELKIKVRRFDFYYFDKVENAAFSYEEHLEIIEAIKAKDLERAMEKVEANWKQSFLRFR